MKTTNIIKERSSTFFKLFCLLVFVHTTALPQSYDWGSVAIGGGGFVSYSGISVHADLIYFSLFHHLNYKTRYAEPSSDVCIHISTKSVLI